MGIGKGQPIYSEKKSVWNINFDEQIFKSPPISTALTSLGDYGTYDRLIATSAQRTVFYKEGKIFRSNLSYVEKTQILAGQHFGYLGTAWSFLQYYTANWIVVQLSNDKEFSNPLIIHIQIPPYESLKEPAPLVNPIEVLGDYRYFKIYLPTGISGFTGNGTVAAYIWDFTLSFNQIGY